MRKQMSFGRLPEHAGDVSIADMPFIRTYGACNKGYGTEVYR